jgi:hypothetical protein
MRDIVPPPSAVASRRNLRIYFICPDYKESILVPIAAVDSRASFHSGGVYDVPFPLFVLVNRGAFDGPTNLGA